jgi:hypothetical protein
MRLERQCDYFQPTLLNHANMPANTTEIEAKVAAAIAAMDANPRLKAIDAARQFDAPYQRLR